MLQHRRTEKTSIWLPQAADSCFTPPAFLGIVRSLFQENLQTTAEKALEIPMARQCEACGKTVQVGNRIETRGKAKYLGGVGTKITGITRRKFVPNLQRVHVTMPNGQNKSMRVCTQCIRSGAIRKTVKTKPFDVGVASGSR